MTPPQLSADAPVLDVVKPSVVYFLKSFWHNIDVAIADSLQEWQQLDKHASHSVWKVMAS